MGNIKRFKQHTYTPNEFYDYLHTVENAMSGDINIVLKFDELEDVALADINEEDMSQAIAVELQDTDGNVHEWYNGTLKVKIVTSGDGVAADEEDDPIVEVDIVNGKGSFTVYYTGTWINEETVTVTVGQAADTTKDTILGYTNFEESEVVLTVEAAG